MPYVVHGFFRALCWSNCVNIALWLSHWIPGANLIPLWVMAISNSRSRRHCLYPHDWGHCPKRISKLNAWIGPHQTQKQMSPILMCLMRGSEVTTEISSMMQHNVLYRWVDQLPPWCNNSHCGPSFYKTKSFVEIFCEPIVHSCFSLDLDKII